MVDEGRVRRLLDRIAAETEALRVSAAEHDDATLLAHANLLPAVKYRFVVTIEAAVDVGEHIIAAEQLRAPESYADVFRVLGEHGWLSDDLALHLQRMAGFRNVLVHAYQEVDDHHVIAVQRTRLADLDGFRREIATGLAGDEPGEPLDP